MTSVASKHSKLGVLSFVISILGILMGMLGQADTFLSGVGRTWGGDTSHDVSIFSQVAMVLEIAALILAIFSWHFIFNSRKTLAITGAMIASVYLLGCVLLWNSPYFLLEILLG